MHCLFSESQHLRCYLHGDERLCVAHFVWSIYRQTRRMKRATLENCFLGYGSEVAENPTVRADGSDEKSVNDTEEVRGQEQPISATCVASIQVFFMIKFISGL